MTIERDRKTKDMVLTCNTCRGEERFAPSTHFVSLVRWVKAQGWRAFQSYERWRHECAGCIDRQKQARLNAVDRERLHA